jgi:vitamin B12/bleomycin/antimicrobial peptide transport system ATP-binding/permease protein
MDGQKFPLHRQTLEHFLGSLKRFATAPDVGRRALWMFAALLALQLGINGLNVLNSYVGRDFMTAIEDRNRAEFIRQALLYIGVFAALTLTSVLCRFSEERLGLLWREWTTTRSILRYGNHRVYYRLRTDSEVGNPDQRIAEDIRTYTTTTLSFMLMLCNSSITVIAFSGVLWSISPKLFMVSVVYAAAGSLIMFLLGRPLVQLNYDQLDKEANLRSSLTFLRANAESVALTRREGGLMQLALRNLDAVVKNMCSLISINRTVNYCSTGYNWLMQIIPALLVAPLFIEGKVQFGVITQSAIAFTQLLGAFSLIITQFQSISSYTAVISRLSTMVTASEREAQAEQSAAAGPKDENCVSYQGLTLLSPRSGRVLINELKFTIPRYKNMLVCGQDETARSALFNATASLFKISGGTIIRPPLDKILFVGESPYLPPGTVRELLMRPLPEEGAENPAMLEQLNVSEERMAGVLSELKIESIVKGYGGLDTRQHWENVLPLAEQKLLIVARLLLVGPSFVFLERPSATLDPEHLAYVLGLLRHHKITFVTFEERGAHLEYYDRMLELERGGVWTCKSIVDGHICSQSPQSPG